MQRKAPGPHSFFSCQTAGNCGFSKVVFLCPRPQTDQPRTWKRAGPLRACRPSSVMKFFTVPPPPHIWSLTPHTIKWPPVQDRGDTWIRTLGNWVQISTLSLTKVVMLAKLLSLSRGQVPHQLKCWLNCTHSSHAGQLLLTDPFTKLNMGDMQTH